MDEVNYDVLGRYWPMRPYGYPGWWQYVGRTRRQRDGLTRRKPDPGPRGRCGTTEANAISGEVSR